MFELTEKQKEIISSRARIKLVMGGMRSGKTSTALLNLEEIIKRNNGDALYLVNSENISRCIQRKIKEHFSVISYKILGSDKTVRFKTKYGNIYVSTDYESHYITNIDFRVITMDNSTSNKFFNEHFRSLNDDEYLINEIDTSMYLTGHIPEDKENNFYKLWIKYCFIDNANCKSFRISTWDNPSMSDKKEDYKRKLISSLGLQKYLRQYECVPDYTEPYVAREYLNDLLKSSQISLEDYKFRI